MTQLLDLVAWVVEGERRPLKLSEERDVVRRLILHVLVKFSQSPVKRPVIHTRYALRLFEFLLFMLNFSGGFGGSRGFLLLDLLNCYSFLLLFFLTLYLYLDFNSFIRILTLNLLAHTG